MINILLINVSNLYVKMSDTYNINNQRNERQINNNYMAYTSLKKNLKKIDIKYINNKALERLLDYTGYKNIYSMIKDKDNHEENIYKIISLYIAKNASRQGKKDEYLQYNYINKLQKHGIVIMTGGTIRPIKTGGLRLYGDKKNDELKTIDFLIYYREDIIGYITAKVTSGNGGHQDNVLNEITQFCEWSLIQTKNTEKKAYIILYDNPVISNLYSSIQKTYSSVNILFTNTPNFKKDFLKWFNNNYEK